VLFLLEMALIFLLDKPVRSIAGRYRGGFAKRSSFQAKKHLEKPLLKTYLWELPTPASPGRPNSSHGSEPLHSKAALNFNL